MHPPFFLHTHEIHIWKIDLADLRWDCMLSALAADEQGSTVQVSEVRKRQRRSRIALRLLLARYAGCDPSALRFQYGPFGKPALSDANFHFNLAHSEDKSVLAVCPMPLGVDLEWTQHPSLDVDEVSSAIFHLHDKKEFALLHDGERLKFFYRIWTQKESYLKALGLGLQRTPAAVYFSSVSSSSAEVHDEMAEEDTQYFVHRLHVFENFAASVCVPDAAPRIVMHDARPQEWIDRMSEPGKRMPGSEACD